MTKRIFYKRYGKIAQSQEFIDVTCKTCSVTYLKFKPTLKKWRGNCRSCAQKLEKNKPENRLALSQRARIQVLKQGGIPNAKKFTPGSTAGEKNCKWIKDRSQLKIKRSMKESVDWRNSVYERDNYTCQICHAKGGKLNADHIKPWCLYPELRFELSNGRTLCVECHRNTPTYGGRASRKVSDGTNLYETSRTAAIVA